MQQSWQLVLLWGVVVGHRLRVYRRLSRRLSSRRAGFTARQGLVIGILTAASAAGQLVFLPSMAALVTHAGWRVMSLMPGRRGDGFFVPLVALADARPAGGSRAGRLRRHARPRPAPPPTGNPIAVTFRALADGARPRDFWLIAGGYFVCGASTNGLIGTHLIPACVDHGLTEVVGAGLLAATGVFAFIGGTLSGWLSDRWDNRFLLVLVLRAARPVADVPAVRLRHVVLRSDACSACFTGSTGSPACRRRCGC